MLLAPPEPKDPNHEIHVMKNTARVPRQHRVKSTAPQAVTKATKPQTVTLIFLNSKNGRECLRMKILATTFNRLKNAAKEFGLSVEDFFIQAFNEKISREVTNQSAAIVNHAMGMGGAH